MLFVSHRSFVNDHFTGRCRFRLTVGQASSPCFLKSPAKRGRFAYCPSDIPAIPVSDRRGGGTRLTGHSVEPAEEDPAVRLAASWCRSVLTVRGLPLTMTYQRISRTSKTHRKLSKLKKIILIQGANLNYLGKREPEIYGRTTPDELNTTLLDYARRRSFELEIFYTNLEGEAINRIYQCADQGFDGVVMNPAGFSYAGYALKDCI